MIETDLHYYMIFIVHLIELKAIEKISCIYHIRLHGYPISIT